MPWETKGVSDQVEGFVRASCARCGAVDVRAADATLHMTPAGSVDPRSVASFQCPSCEERVEQSVDERTAGLLITAGVSLGIPAEQPRQPDRT